MWSIAAIVPASWESQAFHAILPVLYRLPGGLARKYAISGRNHLALDQFHQSQLV